MPKSWCDHERSGNGVFVFVIIMRKHFSSCNMSWRNLEDVWSSLGDVLKLSWRRLEVIFAIWLENVVKMSLKTRNCHNKDLLKICLARLQLLFTKVNVCWVAFIWLDGITQLFFYNLWVILLYKCSLSWNTFVKQS